MEKKDKQLVFEQLLKDFETDMFKAYFNDMVGEIPDYIFTMPSSTSGKYHNATQCEKFGQVYHEYMFASILNHRLRLKGNREKYNTPEIRDCMRCVPVFHDAIKCGWNGSVHTVHEHPMLAAEWVRNTKVENDIPSEYKEMIAGMCEAHSGEWTTNRRSSVVLPEPRNDMELFIHECDILSSRSDLDIIIPSGLKDILFGVKSTENEEVIVEVFEVPKKEIPKLDEWVLPFGKKHKGKTLPQILEIDPEYILWAKENITSEPARSLLKQL